MRSGRGVSGGFLFLVRWLLSRSQQAGPDVAIRDLERYLIADTIELTEILAVDGCTAASATVVAGMELLPWSTVPMTDTKWRIAMRFVFGEMPPTMAVAAKHTIYRQQLRPWEQLSTSPQYSIEPMRDLLRCVTATAGAGVRMMHHWFEPPEWAPWAVLPIRFLGDAMNMSMTANLVDEGSSLLRACVDQFSALDEEQRQRLRVPLDRLNRSYLAGIRSVDAATDLGIALESLFAPTRIWKKLDLRLAKRAAVLLGSDDDERKRIEQAILDAYDVRSHAVHAGRFDGSGADERWREAAAVCAAIQDGQRLAGRSLVKVILDGEPDWEQVDLA
jgi:hypothetical protein